MELKFRVHARIAKSVYEVFDAVVDPDKLSGYFTGASTGPLVEGKTVSWSWSDYPGVGDVTVRKVVSDELIVFEWAGGPDGAYQTRVEITFVAIAPTATVISISESGWHEDQGSLDSSYGNCFGWTQMLCALKCYLERGFNLREGFFEGPTPATDIRHS